MYEAAAVALENFREHDCAPGVASELEVQVRTAVTHTIAVKKLSEWAGEGGRSPRDTVLKQTAEGNAEDSSNQRQRSQLSCWCA